MSAFTVSELNLPFSQLLMFVPIGHFFLFRHWFFERGAFPSRSASGPSRMSVDVLVGVVGDIARIQNSGKHGLSLLRSSGDCIRRFDENAWIGVVSMFGRVQSLHSDRTLARARSLRSDRAGRALSRYVATELWLELTRYVATERDERSVAT
ncbi:hypothetical protein F2Q70_00014834 [Brassica cretica]|uniref:Uncharacterized protein n=1 Tax=Brassica cretica TaxID=69181 RepID=A0A8S9I5P3_BRACR|nr:hypothetical protein F2Q70_00014834 [Brassica cretica]